jgi:hypothetical protein
MKPKKLFRPLCGRNSFLGFNFFHAHLLTLEEKNGEIVLVAKIATERFFKVRIQVKCVGQISSGSNQS